jgi:hypothetical protein
LAGLVVGCTGATSSTGATPLPTAAVVATATPSQAASPSRPLATPTARVTALSTAKPKATPHAGGYAWHEGGPSWVAGDVVATPAGYLATCTDEGQTAHALCSSRDLITWTTPPDRATYAGPNNGQFLPYVVIDVKSGYAARSDDGSGTKTAWYSADGKTWQEGIPSGQQIPAPCVPGSVSPGSCLTVDWVVSNPRTGLSLAWSDGALLMSTNGWATRTKVTADNPHGMPDAPVIAADGTWLASCYWTADLPLSLISSRDGTHWTELDSTPGTDVGSYAVLGKDEFATFLSDEGEALTYFLYESRDGGATWLPVVDSAGAPIDGRYVHAIGSRVVVDDGLGQFQWVGAPKA